MIKKPTVIILGAGASKPYGFPSGREILYDIQENLRPQRWIQILRTLHIKQAVAEEFVKDLLKSSRPSVDAFLEYREEYMEVGKLAIALSLIPHEKEGNLFRTYREEHWYEHLLNKLITQPGVFETNKLTIITFNYDRSIEHFLFEALKSDFGKTDDECAILMKRISIIHVHGKLGNLPWEGNDYRPYDDKIEPRKVKLASDQIKVIPEGEMNTKEFSTTFEKMIEAERIYFLGFGYNKMNLCRLKIKEITGLKDKIIQGTSYGLGKIEKLNIEQEWGIELPDTNLKTLDFLKNIAYLD